jgi:hypothetical protein
MYKTCGLLLGMTLLSACAHTSTDALALGKKQLRAAPCGNEMAVSGAAGANANPRRVYLGDWALISVCHLDDLLKQSEAQQKQIHLFMQGLDTGNGIEGIDHDKGILTFILDRNARNKSLWQPLLYNPLFEGSSDIHVSVGLEGSQPLPQVQNANMHLELEKLYVDWTTYAWAAFLIVLSIALFWYGYRSDLLRVGPAMAGTRQPYSLDRVQMAWWFGLIVLGYVFIWLVTGDQDMVTASLLGLMGISSATALASAAITPQGGPLGPRRKLLEQEITAIDDALAQITIHRAAAMAAAPPRVELSDALAMKAAALSSKSSILTIEHASLTSVAPSAGFWRDLVCDERGSAALDRFQIIAWTLVLGGIFISSVIWELTMPEFSATMLTLMGISSGAYIGFKFPKDR